MDIMNFRQYLIVVKTDCQIAPDQIIESNLCNVISTTYFNPKTPLDITVFFYILFKFRFFRGECGQSVGHDV